MQLEPYARHIVNGVLMSRTARVEVGTEVFLLKNTLAFHSDRDRPMPFREGDRVTVMGLCIQYTKKGNIPFIAVQRNNVDDVPFTALVDPNDLCYAECPVDRVIQLARTQGMETILRNNGYEQPQKIAELLYSYGIRQLQEGKL